MRRSASGSAINSGSAPAARALEDFVSAVEAGGCEEEGMAEVTGCIKTLRRNIAQRLRKHRNLVVGDQDVVAHSEQGYQLREWISVRDAADEEAEVAAESDRLEATRSEASIPPVRNPTDGNAPGLNERQKWVLEEAANGRRPSLLDLQRKFRVSEKTAKRDFAGLESLPSAPRAG